MKADFLEALGNIPHSRDAAALRVKSADFSWFSPIMSAALAGRQAEVVVSPRDEQEVVTIASACARHRVPLVARGGGTGNFGQAVPLAGGAVVEMVGLDRLVFQKGNVARAQAGIRLGALDEQLRKGGRELRMHPSTKKLATLGGFVGGGHAGVGTVNWGILRDRGNLLGLKIITIEEKPRVLELRGDDVNLVHHAYGVNGLVTEVELPLAPAYEWLDTIVAFDDFERAAAFGMALATADGVLKKLVSVHAWPIPGFFVPLKPHLPEGRAAALLMIGAETREAFEALVRDFGGSVTMCVPQANIYEYTWGHTTMHALRADRSLTYLVCIFPKDGTLGAIGRVHRKLGAEVMLHLEFKRFAGYMTAEGVPLFRYQGFEQMTRLYKAFEAEGVRIANAHTFLLQNGGMKDLDAAQIDFKRAVDPHLLMNPGKVAGLDDLPGGLSGAALEAAQLPASGWAY
ncbi:MAG TPA: FAD-binding oxidoreductase [Burkholderiales bacterium]